MQQSNLKINIMNLFKHYCIFLTVFISFNAFSATPLVDAEWLNENLKNQDIILLDIRNKDYFEYVHLPNSVNSQYSDWRQPQSNILKKMLPTKDYLEKLLSKLGIQNNDHVIIISSGESATELAAASRVYWTLEQINHAKKSILNGGVIAWAKKQLPLTRRAEKPPKESKYQIQTIKQQVDFNSVLNSLDQNEQIIDARSIAENKGLILSASDERTGAIPTSKALPYDWFTLNGGGNIHSEQNLQAILKSIDYQADQSTTVYCHTAHRAALSWFVLSEVLGNKQVKLYDGSTREWATNPELPLTSEINIEF